MQFASPPAACRMPSVLPLLGVSMLPVLVLLVLACCSLSREDLSVRLPGNSLPRPPIVHRPPMISVRISREGAVTMGGEAIAEEALAAAWRRERAALRLLGYEPSQATVVVRGDADLPTERVERLMETAQAAGFQHCVLRPAETSPPRADSRGTEP